MKYLQPFSSAGGLRAVAVSCIWTNLIWIGLSSGAARGAADDDKLALIPWPKSVVVGRGELVFQPRARLRAAEAALAPLAKILADEMYRAHGLRPAVSVGEAGPGDLELKIEKGRRPRSYALRVADRATVAGADYNAVAQGTVTLLQAMRRQDGKVSVPRLAIEDEPYFAYCGAMLDVARKPHSLETLRQCVEAARFYKIRFIHLHLSDENAWTFPSTAYPELGKTNFAWAGGDKPTVYPLEGLKELVAYADARGVTFVPELETPGHSGALRGSLPQIFGYFDESGKPIPSGVINMASDEAYRALDTIVGEMCDVFKSSPYFHIGCDEASVDIENIPAVHKWAERHNLPRPYVASVFCHHVRKMNEIVKKHGKRMIVWEGAPLEPLPPPKDVIFMPWVGGHGMAAEYVRRGYEIINPPWGTKKEYFDPFDVNGAQIPRDQRLLIGATSISWEAVENMALPFFRFRAALRNEPTYNPDAGRDLDDFLFRHRRTDALLDKLIAGLTFRAEGLLPPVVFGRPEAVFTDRAVLTLDTHLEAAPIRYTLDGTDVQSTSALYRKPIVLTDTATVRARAFPQDRAHPLGEFTRAYAKATPIPHDAVGAKVVLDPDTPGYFGPGPKGLTDGMLALGDSYGDPGWLGWNVSQPIVATLELSRRTTVRTVAARFGRSGGGLEIPKNFVVQLSDDGQAFRDAAEVGREKALTRRGWYVAELARPTPARFIRVTAAPGGEWTFLDEVAVNAQPPGPNFRHAALGKPVALATPPSPSYSQSGLESLTDGYIGFTPHCANLGWLGWEGKNIEATVDLGKPRKLRSAGGHFMQFVFAGVFLPGKIDVLVSNDGREFLPAATIVTPQPKDGQLVRTLSADLKGITARYVRFVAYTNGMWLFLDELIVNPENEKGGI